jgi:glutamyl endopeptidase
VLTLKMAASALVGLALLASMGHDAASRTPRDGHALRSHITSGTRSTAAVTVGYGPLTAPLAYLTASRSLPDRPHAGSREQGKVIGLDDRRRVRNTESFPARALVFFTRLGDAWCTGWLYGPDVVATAAHCVFEEGRWIASELRAYPGSKGRNIATDRPYGSCGVRAAFAPDGFFLGDREYDYAILKLDCKVGMATGWFGYWAQDEDLTGLTATISGYPVDKRLGTQWRHTDRITRTLPRRVEYEIDTQPGQSGAPVYLHRPDGSAGCSGYCVMAIHWGGNDVRNVGVRLTDPVIANLVLVRDSP